jgi:hypothetical protein
MLEPDQWDSVLGNVTGTIVHGSERVSSNRLMDLLGVETDPTRRREVGKSPKTPTPVPPAGFFPSCARAALPVAY